MHTLSLLMLLDYSAEYGFRQFNIAVVLTRNYTHSQ